jgi:SWI/SNF-related matrix-associated actin-dependent regulator 1 of chromatin subfamily A
MLKNMQSMRYRNLMRIHASRRLLLTGTPLQNNLIELMSLLAFAMPNMFEDQAENLKTIFQTITVSILFSLFLLAC